MGRTVSTVSFSTLFTFSGFFPSTFALILCSSLGLAESRINFFPRKSYPRSLVLAVSASWPKTLEKKNEKGQKIIEKRNTRKKQKKNRMNQNQKNKK